MARYRVVTQYFIEEDWSRMDEFAFSDKSTADKTVMALNAAHEKGKAIGIASVPVAKPVENF